MQDENFNENLSLTDDETPLPEGWRLVRLGDVCEVVTGGTPPRSESKFYHGSIPWIKPDDLDKSIYVETSAEYLSDEGGKISRLLPKGSVLVSCIGNIGKLAIAAKTLTTNQQINSLIPSENIDSLYLYYACKVIKPKLISEASISLVSILNKSNFSNIKIPLPPTIEEQRRIAAILDEQMKAVEAARAAVEEQLAAARLLPNAFLRSVFESEDAQNWQKRKLGDVCDVVTGGTPPRSEARFYGGSIAWIKPDDLDKSIYVEKSAEYLTEEGGKISRLLPEGSVLVSCIGNIGKLAIAAKTLATNQQINSLIPSEKVDSLYLFYTCKFMKPVFNSEASISLVSILNKSGFSNIEIPLPTKSEQRKIAERLNEQMQAVETLKQSLTEKLEAVKKFPAALLRKAFAGEI